MKADEIYQETIPFPVGRLVLVIMTGITAPFIFLFIYQLTSGPVGDRSAPNWFYLIILVIFAGISVLMTNFTKLSVSLTPDASLAWQCLIPYKPINLHRFEVRRYK